ncbi:MAG: LacI family DNA-binding transcriptional regulator [Candidatus Nanopelagicales bacterium]
MSADQDSRRRVTIADIARRSGVTSGAVSMAVNGKPGVSDATRARVLQIADEMHWRPNHAAQALRGKDAEAIGLVLARPEEAVGEEAFFARFIAGVQSVLSQSGYSLLLQMAPDLAAESAIHASWIADRRVDGILVLDPRVEDPRVKALLGKNHPTIVVGGNTRSGKLSSVRTDDRQLMKALLDHLVGLGHQRIGYVTGDQRFAHVRTRIEAFGEYGIDRGIWGATLAGDFSPVLSKEATRRFLASPRPPTAIVYDSEVMAIAGLGTLTEMGVAVPGAVSLASWEDSATCRVVHPTITALDRDAVSLGRLAATEMLQLLAGDPVAEPVIGGAVIPRESTAAPRAV